MAVRRLWSAARKQVDQQQPQLQQQIAGTTSPDTVTIPMHSHAQFANNRPQTNVSFSLNPRSEAANTVPPALSHHTEVNKVPKACFLSNVRLEEARSRRRCMNHSNKKPRRMPVEARCVVFDKRVGSLENVLMAVTRFQGRLVVITRF